MSDTLPPIEILRQYFSYNPETGLITKLKLISVKDRVLPGSIVGGTPDNGYYRTKIMGVRVHIHQLAYALHTGAWAPSIVDHKDRNPLNNRIDNLRPASNRQNHYNTVQAFSNKTGYRGVVHKGGSRFKPYAAVIRDGRKRKFLGAFFTAEETSKAYETAAQKLHGEFYIQPNSANG